MLMTLMTAVAAVMAVPTAASGANNSGINSGASGVPVRDFDAITTVKQNNVWKHLALIQDRYVIFNDNRILEGPGRIREKWPFLPADFHRDLDSASVHFSTFDLRWQYTFTKGASAIIFEDSGIVAGPLALQEDYDAISSYNIGRPLPVVYFAVRGSQFAFFPTLPGRAVDTPLSSMAGLPEEFTHDLDDVSVEIENGSAKFSFYRDNQRFILQNGRFVPDIGDLLMKWPFLLNFRLP